MGKARRKKPSAAAASSSSSSGPSSHPLGKRKEETVEEEDVADVVKTITAQLQDATSESKECGLTSLALLVEQRRQGPAVVQAGLVRIAAPLLIDAEPGVRLAAAGALKNLSLVSADICDDMVKQDVMTALCTLLTTHYSDPESSANHDDSAAAKKKSTNVVDQKASLFVESVNLLWNLCEANATALAVLNREDLVRVLLRHLRPRQPEANQANLAVMQCVYTVSEDNPAAAQAVRENWACFESLLGLGKADEEGQAATSPLARYLQVLAVGVLLNTKGAEEGAEIPEKVWKDVVGVLAAALEVDQRKMVNDFTSLCPLANGESKSEGDDEEQGESMDDGERPDAKVDDARKQLDEVIRAQQTALEILTNMACGEDDDEWVEEDEEQSDDMDSDSDAASHTSSTPSSGGAGGAASNPIQLPVFLVESFQQHRVVPLVLSKANLPPENVCSILRDDARQLRGRQLLRALHTLRSRAFLCLNNLANALSVEELGGGDVLFETWSGLGRLCFGEEGDASADAAGGAELLESATSALRALTHKLCDEARARPAQSRFAALTGDDLARMLRFGAAHAEANVRMNVVQAAGDLGSLLAAESAESESSAALVAQFLAEAATKDVNLRVVAEALDKIFDMFGEDDTDALCAEVGLVPRLKGMLPGLKVKMQRNRKDLGEEDFGIVCMAKTNLVRFIRYKEKRPAAVGKNGH